MIRSDFCAFILTHGRPDAVYTYSQLRVAGYTGKIYVVIDDEDATADKYRERFGEEVLTFSKAEAAKTFDEGDNFDGRRGVVYARNTLCGLAAKVGCRYFLELDDDYTSFFLRTDAAGGYGATRVRKTMDLILEAMLSFYKTTPIMTIAMSQGGDHIGGSGGAQDIRLSRKAMNAFICSVERPLNFVGRINEDVNLYVTGNRRGELYFTTKLVQLNQKQTQACSGGMTELYLDQGTYIKSFYSVMYEPSCVQVGTLTDSRSNVQSRFHHAISWPHTSPMILGEQHRKSPRRREDSGERVWALTSK